MRKTFYNMRKYAASFIMPVLVSIPLSPLIGIVEKYLFADWEYLKFLIIFMIIDTLASWWYHFKKKDFSSKGFSQLFTKIIIYSLLLIIAHGFASYSIGGETIEAMKWFRTFICTALLVREAISIVEKFDKIKPGIIPESITKRLKSFEDKGKFDKND